MKRCHAAALALVGWCLLTGSAAQAAGWYLMIPPVSELPNIRPGNSGFFSLFSGEVYDAQKITLGQAMDLMRFGDWEPVFSSAWITLASFDTLDKCESYG